ncbi:MAG: hypothetical protein PHV82_13655 [Victivallaceae bacterium]|nr:hypothetical protein [Victivallaceae bacterium]
MLWYTPNGELALGGNGNVAVAKQCPCGCYDFEGRRIIYVDKYAVGAGNGSSWENAYTNIQAAANAHPNTEIQIKGYGEDDCYPAGISLPECAYLHGADTGSGAVWLDGEDTVYSGITGNSTNKVLAVNLKNCSGYGFYRVGYLDGCTVNDIGKLYFYQCLNIENCVAERINYSAGLKADGFLATADDGVIYNCIANNVWNAYMIRGAISASFANNCGNCGFFFDSGDITATDCIADGCAYFGFIYGVRSGANQTDLINCVAKNGGFGFGRNQYDYGEATFTSCSAFNNQNCGFISNQVAAPNYIDCSEYDNCLSGESSCTPGYPYYICDEV